MTAPRRFAIRAGELLELDAARWLVAELTYELELVAYEALGAAAEGGLDDEELTVAGLLGASAGRRRRRGELVQVSSDSSE